MVRVGEHTQACTHAPHTHTRTYTHTHLHTHAHLFFSKSYREHILNGIHHGRHTELLATQTLLMDCVLQVLEWVVCGVDNLREREGGREGGRQAGSKRVAEGGRNFGETHTITHRVGLGGGPEAHITVLELDLSRDGGVRDCQVGVNQ